MENQEAKNEEFIGGSGLNAGLGWPTPKPSILKPLSECKYYANDGILYMDDGGKEQDLIGSFRRAGRSAELARKMAEFAAHCMNMPNVELRGCALLRSPA